VTKQHDVIVVGAGPAGSATAYFLARQGADVLLLDKAEFPRDKTCGDAISPRGLRVLADMGLLDELSAESHRVHSLHIYAPNGNRAVAAVPRAEGYPPYALVVPRLRLDASIQARACAAGAEFRGRHLVADIICSDGAACGVQARTPHGLREYDAGGVVIATGAATRLLESAGLLPAKPVHMLAARAYFDNVLGIDDQIEFYFNQVSLPGYGWMFPTGPHSANVGVGYIGDLHPSPRSAFQQLIATHPRLQTILADAETDGVVKGFPLRVDFHRAQKTAPGIVATGEAVGLVNPFTGEGIDYALESGQLAAGAIADLLTRGAPWTTANLAHYERALDRRFKTLFVMMMRARRLYYNRMVLNRIFGANRQALLETLMGIVFSNADPGLAFAPRTLLQIARP